MAAPKTTEKLEALERRVEELEASRNAAEAAKAISRAMTSKPWTPPARPRQP